MAYEFEYLNLLDSLLQRAAAANRDGIPALAQKLADTIRSDRIIHMFGTGHSHMAGIELFCRAGGLGPVDVMLDPDCLAEHGARRSCALERLTGLADVIYDQYVISPGDIMIITSNSGRNAVPVEMAARCRREGIWCCAVTNLAQSQACTSRAPCGKKLYELADLVLDTCVPAGDAMMQIGTAKTGPGSTIASLALLNTAATEALKILQAEGCELPVFQSQNVDGYDNDALYERYGDRIKNF